MIAGRPLRFLVLALGGWVMIRVALLLPELAPVPVSLVTPRVIAGPVPQVSAAALHRAMILALVASTPLVSAPTIERTTFHRQRRWTIRPPRSIAAAVPDVAYPVEPSIAYIPSPVAPPVPLKQGSRLSGSVWLLARGGPAGTVSGGQLGASQGGLRLAYAVDGHRTVSVVARVATPLQGIGREAALGLEWQPTRLPIRLVAEQRFALDGGRGGATLGVIAGYGPTDVAAGVRLEAYGQAGAIARDGLEGFADVSARLTYPVGAVAGVRVDVGVGAWGSAQKAAERFDLGPSMVATTPVAGKTFRLTLDWRARITGSARPGSGPALSIGSDF